jgi:hypothetical protein
VSGSAAIDTVWIRTNRPCLSYFRPHRGVAELLFAGRLFPPVSKLGYRLRKYGYFGYYNVNENGSRKVLCTADGMNEDKASSASFFQRPGDHGLGRGQLMVEEKCLGILEPVREVSPEAIPALHCLYSLLPWIPK